MLRKMIAQMDLNICVMITKEIDIQRINEMIDQGYIMKNKHPEADLWIYNYTQSAQYEQVWNDETLMCRGLILDTEGKVVARPISKFFNIEEVGVDMLPELPFDVYEKMDGSLGVLYCLDGKAHIATRGSFASKQAVFANELLNSKYKKCVAMLDQSKTYVFEIIYPENRIVIDYSDKEELVLLAIVDTNSGEEFDLENIGFPLPKKYAEFTDFREMKELNWENHEGFVIRYENNFRVKVKFEDYIATHRIVTQLSSLTIWERLMANESIISDLEEVPDEFYGWARKTEEKLKAEYKEIEDFAFSEMKTFPTYRETAEYFMTCTYSRLMFAIWKKKNYQKLIWKMVRPKFEKAYSNQ